MLKITVDETPAGLQWIVQGDLVGAWVDELRNHWEQTRRNRKPQSCAVSLEDVTSIDRAGERLLQTFARAGAQFSANGVYIKHLIERLKSTPGSDAVNAKKICQEKAANPQVSKHGKLKPHRRRARRQHH